MACRVFRGVALEMMEHLSFQVDSIRIDAALELEPLPLVPHPEPTEPCGLASPHASFRSKTLVSTIIVFVEDVAHHDSGTAESHGREEAGVADKPA
ncbi:hypothetical protein HWV62_494 [Athelia sp. TMB]|nr:hypothetical protein HWV62_494 [Athelia sp. TMB]